jgi:HTH-type transcriptional regulator / antitoxin HipB
MAGEHIIDICGISNKVVLLPLTHIDILCAMAHSATMSDLARTPKQIGTIIQRARKKRCWTQTQLAELAGLRQETISVIESGEKPSKLASILAVLAALDLEFRIGERSKGAGQDIEDLF